jgi:hypothetical protein
MGLVNAALGYVSLDMDLSLRVGVIPMLIVACNGKSARKISSISFSSVRTLPPLHSRLSSRINFPCRVVRGQWRQCC